jgi:hypothetical protein
MKSTAISITDTQKALPKLVREMDCFAITKNGRTQGFYLSKAKVDAILETLDTLQNETAMAAIRQYRAGKMKLKDVSCLDED